MANWERWADKVVVVRSMEDPSTPEKDLEVLRKVFVPLGAALASGASRSQLYHDLAECQVKGECSVLKYDPKKDRFVFSRNGKERELNPDLFVERGFKVCKSKDTGDVYIRFGKSQKGMLAVSYEGVSCDPGDETLGTVHLHPAGAVFPSGADMFFSVLSKYNCIAGKVYDPEEKKEYARVFCSVTDDDFLYDLSDEERRTGHIDASRIFAEYPELLKLKSEYESVVRDSIQRYDMFLLKVEDAEGNRVEYIFPPRAAGAVYELVRKAKEVYKDISKFELYTVDLSRSEPPSLSTLER